jgi:hypothetical protein
MLNEPVISGLHAPPPTKQSPALQHHTIHAFGVKMDASEEALMAELRTCAREVDTTKVLRNIHSCIEEWIQEAGAHPVPRLTRDRTNALEDRLFNAREQWPNADHQVVNSFVAQGIDRPLGGLLAELRGRITADATMSAQRGIHIQQRLNDFQQVSTAAANLNASLNEAYKTVIQRL